MKQPGKRRWIAVLLVISIFTGSVCGAFWFKYQRPKAVYDLTEKDQEDGGDGGKDKPSLLSPSVKLFLDDEASLANKSIVAADSMSDGVHITVKDSENHLFSQLNRGDVFLLEGDETSPLGETYIGKIASRQTDGDTIEYLVTVPGIEEAFDELHFDIDAENIPLEDISVLEAAEGVTVTYVEDINAAFSGMDVSDRGLSNRQGGVMLASAKAGQKDKSLSASVEAKEDGLILNAELDLLKAFGMDAKKLKTNGLQEKCPQEQSSSEIVYRTTTGNCYHLATCPCVGRSSYELTLSEASKEGFEACFLCNPPIIARSTNAEMKLTGKVGINDINVQHKFDWGLSGIENLQLNVSANTIAQAELKTSLYWELKMKETQKELPGLKLQGLREKMFPLAFLGYNFVQPVTLMCPNKGAINTATSMMPITLAIVVYVDVAGNITVEGLCQFNYTNRIRYANNIVEDGKWIWDSNVDANQNTAWTLKAEAKGDLDAHAGVSLMVYVFNVNVVELAFAKIGGEIEGKFKITTSSSTDFQKAYNLWDNIKKSPWSARIYLKLLDLHLNMKIKTTIGDISGEIKENWLYQDITLASWGNKPETRCDFYQMKYGRITASDEFFLYFKNEEGHLVKKGSESYDILSHDEFISICGIDEPYLYVIRNDEKGKGIYRISKGDGTSRQLVSDVEDVLLMDETYLYYVPAISGNTIERLNRETLQTQLFASFREHIEIMLKQGESFYVITKDNDFFSAFFGSSSYYYLLDSDGNKTQEYGKSPKLTNYPIDYKEGKNPYYAVMALVSGGYLRLTAGKVYWMSLDKSQSKNVETAGGWNMLEDGILYVSQMEDHPGYSINMIKAENGEAVTLLEVNNSNAIYTLAKGNGENWYYFDQSEEGIILYKCKADFSNPVEVKKFDKEFFPYDLAECGVEIRENCLFFYSMPDDAHIDVLYRYSF